MSKYLKFIAADSICTDVFVCREVQAATPSGIQTQCRVFAGIVEERPDLWKVYDMFYSTPKSYDCKRFTSLDDAKAFLESLIALESD